MVEVGNSGNDAIEWLPVEMTRLRLDVSPANGLAQPGETAGMERFERLFESCIIVLGQVDSDAVAFVGG